MSGRTTGNNDLIVRAICSLRSSLPKILNTI